MKSLLVFIRIILVGCLWGIIFTEGIRVIMLCNWRFDIFWPDHWRQAIELWEAGWKMRAPKEWAFVLLIVTFVPMLFTGWWTLSMIAWEELIYKLLLWPVKIYRRYIRKQINVITSNNPYGVVKRKSYKEVRPAGIGGIRTPISDYGNDTSSPATEAPAAAPKPAYMTAPFAGSSYAKPPAAAKKNTDVSATIDHALFKFDDDEEDDFDLDIDSFEKTDFTKQPEQKKYKPRTDIDDEQDETDEDMEQNSSSQRRPERKKRSEAKPSDKYRDKEAETSRNRRGKKEKDDSLPAKAEVRTEQPHSPVFDALLQKNYSVVNNVSIKNTLIDYIGVAENEICFCLVDKENGDWLADEEMFNGEEPLWFSENSHRVSPVCRLDKLKSVIESKLGEEGFMQELSFYVIIQMANIINADDMFEVWNEMGINVTRINRGAPKEIALFSKTLNEAEGKADKKDIDRLLKILKNLR